MFGLILAFPLRRLCAFASWGFDDRLGFPYNYVRALRLGVLVLETVKAYKVPYLSTNQTSSISIGVLTAKPW